MQAKGTQVELFHGVSPHQSNSDASTPRLEVDTTLMETECGHPTRHGLNAFNTSTISSLDLLAVPASDSRRYLVATSILDPYLSSTWKRILTTEPSHIVDTAIHLAQCTPATVRLFHSIANDEFSKNAVTCLVPNLAALPQPVWVALEQLCKDDQHSAFMRRLREVQGTLRSGARPRPTSSRGDSNEAPLSPSPSCGHSRASPGISERSSQGGRRFYCPVQHCRHKPCGFSKFGYWKNHLTSQHQAYIEEHSDWEDAPPDSAPVRPSKRRKKKHQPSNVKAAQAPAPLLHGVDMFPTIAQDIPDGGSSPYSPSTLNNDIDANRASETTLYHPSTQVMQDTFYQSQFPQTPPRTVQTSNMDGLTGQSSQPNMSPSSFPTPATPTVRVTAADVYFCQNSDSNVPMTGYNFGNQQGDPFSGTWDRSSESSACYNVLNPNGSFTRY